MTLTSRPFHSLVVLASLALALGACGSDDSSSDADSTDASRPAAQPAADNSDAHDHGDMEGMEGMSDTEHAAMDDNGLGMLHNGHHVDMKYTKLNAADQKQLDKMLALSRQVAKQYPTLGGAIKAGFRRAGPFTPGLGIHYTASWAAQGLNPDGVIDAEDAAHPMMAIFDGTEPSAKFAGFMYYSFAEKQPKGFPGKNDFWHYHTNVCSVYGPDGIDAPFGADRSVSVKSCKKAGGVLMPKTQWMVHVWSVPGYEVSEKDGGVFAEVNPKLTCPDGTYYTMDVKDWAAHHTNVCKSELGSPN